MEDSKPPQVFISYSWESQPHRDWVRYLAEKLRRNGVDARLDQWTVKPGGSFTHFMEAEVAEADYVLVVCTPTYAQKSNARAGGVGYEQQIVSGQLASGTRREKFIPIVRAGTYEAGDEGAIPTQFLGIVSATTPTPAENLSLAKRSSVAVGNTNEGPTPQITSPGAAGEKNPV